jgi:hypothetical protein
MTTTQFIIVIISIVMILVIAVGWGRRGPRVTQIDRTVKREKDKDEPKDGDDA